MMKSTRVTMTSPRWWGKKLVMGMVPLLFFYLGFAVDSMAQTTTLTFETSTSASAIVIGDYTVEDYHPSPSFPSVPLKVLGTAEGYPNKVIQTDAWNRNIRLRRTNNTVFTLTSFQHAEGQWGSNYSGTVRGTFQNGTTQSITISATTKTLQKVTVNWANLTKVEFIYPQAYGVLDNIVVSETNTPCTFSASPTQVVLPSAAAVSNQSVAITASATWSASTTAPWITLTRASGSGNGSVTYSAVANTSTTQRSSTISVTGCGTTSPVTITQPAPMVSPTSCGSITNNGFENGLNGWINNGNTIISTDEHSGANAALTGPGEGGIHYGSLISATGGQTVTFKVWGKFSGTSSFAGVGLDYLNSAGVELSEAVINITSTSYSEYIINATVPAGTANINVWTWKSGATGNLFLDDFCLTVSGSNNNDTQAPSIPANLASTNVTSTSFTVLWSASSDNTAVTGYEVFRNGTSIGTSTTTSFNVTGLTASTVYAMTVRARDAVPNWSAQSTVLNITTSATNDTQAPSIPANLSSSNITQSGFTLSWTASTDNKAVTGYEVFRDGTSIGTTTTTTFNVTGLAGSTTYSITVRARDAVPNWSALSTVLRVSTLANTGSYANENSGLGTNLTEIHAISVSHPLINIAKRAMEWTTDGNYPGNNNRVPNSSLTHDGYLKGGVTGTSGVIWDLPQGAGITGDYVMRYDGSGTVALTSWSGGLTVTSNTPGRITATLNNCLVMQIQISANSTTDPIRNIRITKVAYENSTEIFDPEFLANWGKFNTLRFMDWMHTNASPIQNWQNTTGDFNPQTAPKQSDFSYAVKGAPVELMVALANKLHANPWFCMPHAADNNYNTQFASYVRNNLADDLKAFVEYSNETWNSGGYPFTVQYGYVNSRGLQMWPGTPEWEAGQRYHARRSGEIWTLWEQAFGGTSRFVRVMGGFVGHTNEHWNNLKLLTDNVYQKTDAININFYFGHNIGSSENPVSSVNEVFAKIPASKVSLYEDLDRLREILANDTRYSHIKIVAYEGGQHMAQQNASNILIAANRDTRMGPEYTDLLNNWKQRGGTLFCTFNNISIPSQWGSWGLLERETGNAPNQRIKYDAVINWMNSNPRWWTIKGGTTARLAAAPVAAGDDQDSNLQVYPNPPTDEVNIQVGANASSRAVKVEMYNTMDKKAFTTFQGVPDRDGFLHFSTQQLPGGMYVIKVTNGQTISTERIFIQK